MTTRTVHRGSRGRFAGAKGGRAETVKVGARVQGGTKVAGSPRNKKTTFKQKASALGRQTRKVARNPNVQGAALVGVAVGARALANRQIAKSVRSKRAPLNPAPSWRPGKGLVTGVGGNQKPFNSPNFSKPRVFSMPAGPTNARPMPSGPTRRSASASSSRPASPNYGAAAGRKEFVGRRVTDGNFGLKLGL